MEHNQSHTSLTSSCCVLCQKSLQVLLHPLIKSLKTGCMCIYNSFFWPFKYMCTILSFRDMLWIFMVMSNSFASCDQSVDWCFKRTTETWQRFILEGPLTALRCRGLACQDNQTIRTMYLCKALTVYHVKKKKFEGKKKALCSLHLPGIEESGA